MKRYLSLASLLTLASVVTRIDAFAAEETHSFEGSIFL